MTVAAQPTGGFSNLDNKGFKMKAIDDPDEPKLREALTSALKAAFAEQEPDARTRFHEQFRKEAAEYDRDFLKKYHDDLNTALIFAGLFSAVASAFIVAIQPQMSPDYEQLSFEVLAQLLNVTPGVPRHGVVPKWPGPDPSVIQAQSILFASLASALLAAFLMMLGKQWLNLHVEGSFIERNRHRELKMKGMITWKFKWVMDCLPLIMQLALFLLMSALARYFWSLNRTVSSVIIAFTLFGLAFYIFIVVAATYSIACPFQTPASIMLRIVVRRCKKAHWNFFRPNGGPAPPQNVPLPNPPVSNIDGQIDGIRLDSKCITALFSMTKAPQSIMAIMAYIPEITWDKRIKSIPLLQVYQTLRESLWRSDDGKTLLQPGARERALWSAKALLHLYLQRRCIYGVDEALTNQVQSIGHPRQALCRDGDFDGDSDLQSTFYLVDWAFGVYPKIPWSRFQLSESHHCWLSHILQYRAWESLQSQRDLPDDVEGFLEYTLSRGALPNRVVADCLFIINMVAGHRPQSEDLVGEDRSHKISPLIDDVFNRIETAFSNNSPSGNIAPSIKALRLVVLLRDERICTQSFALFRTLIRLSKKDVRMQEPARLSMRGAHSSTKIPPVEHLQDLLDFLQFHISSQQIPTDSKDSIYHAFRSIALGPGAQKRQEIATCSYFGTSSFIEALILLLGAKDHRPLQKMTLFVIAELDNALFASEAFNEDERAKKFVNAWSTSIGEFIQEVTRPEIEVTGVRVLFAIANSQSLRAWLPPERWELVYKFPTILYSDSPSMKRCIRNPDILMFIKDSDGKIDTLGWLGMLWVNYHALSDEVRGQLVAESAAIASGRRHYDLDSYVKQFDFEIKRLRTMIDDLPPLDKTAVALRGRLDGLKTAKDRLLEVQKDGERARKSPPRSLSPQQNAQGSSRIVQLKGAFGLGGIGGITG